MLSSARDYLTRVDSTLIIASTKHIVCGVPVQIVGAVTFVYVYNGQQRLLQYTGTTRVW